MGRPPEKDREVVKSLIFRVRVCEHQFRRWEKKARSFGMSVSEWVRSVVDRASRV